MSQAQLGKKVADYMRESQTLEHYWQRPITPRQLQAEMESAIIANLPAGNYTAIVRGVSNTTGVALVEVYDLQ